MPRPVEGTSPYNPGLDGVRGIAVLGVIAYHLGFGWASGGLLGVEVFFVLSGYLITDLLVAEYRRRRLIRLGQFWARRARRLLPALFVMLFAVVVWSTLFNRGQLPALRGDLLPGIFYVSNWWFIFHHVSYFAQFGPPSPLGHLWSLAVEEQFYLFWPIIVLAALRWVRNRRIIICGILALAVASAVEMAMLYSPLADPTRIYDGTDTRAFALLFGAALAFVWPRDRTFRPISPGARRVLELVGGASLAGILALYAGTSEYDGFIYQGGMVLLSVLTVLVIAVCIHPGAHLSKVLGVEPLRWVGERSYGIYLWQYPVIILSTRINPQPNYLRGALEVAVTLVISAASWQFIEQPIRHGALARLWARARATDLSSLTRPQLSPRAWALTGGVATGTLVCMLGLAGAVSGGGTPASELSSIVPKAPSTTTTTTQPLQPGATTTTTAPPAGQGVTIIGDSIMEDVEPYLAPMLPGAYFDEAIGQQLYQVQEAVPQLKAAGDIGNRLILELGTNGGYTTTQLQSLLAALGPMEKIVLVNTREDRSWEQPVNQVIAQVAQSQKNITLVDWYGASANQPGWFQPDGVHLVPAGAQQMAKLIVNALNTPPPPPPTTTTTTTTAPATTGSKHGAIVTGSQGKADSRRA